MILPESEVILVRKVLKLHDLWRGMTRRVEERKQVIGLANIWKGSEGRENFTLWSLTHGFEFKLQLDRRDNKLGYSPENCQWLDAYENIVKDQRKIFYAGRMWCYTELARSGLCHPSVKDTNLKARIRQGWLLEEAMKEPVSYNAWSRGKRG